MPRLISLVLAFVAWRLLAEHPSWVAEAPRPVGLIGVFGVSWLAGLRWSLERGHRPWEAGPVGSALLPLLLFAAWMAPFGGMRLLEGWNLPAFVSSWIGLAPYLVLQFGIRFGEAGLAGLAAGGRWRFALGQTRGLLLGILPLALISQVWDSGYAWLPEDPEAWSLGQRAVSVFLDFGAPVLTLALLLVLVPALLGARPGRVAWRAMAARQWQGRGPVPRVLAWPTQRLLANAVAVGFGPFRRVLVSDLLEERLNAQELEAVLAHELAHLRRRHSLSLLLGVLGSVFLLALLVQRFGPGEEAGLGWSLLPLLGTAVFIPASRVFEMQADLDAVARGPQVEAGLVGALTLLGRHTGALQLRHLAGPKRLAELGRCAADERVAAAWQRRAQRWKTGLRAAFAACLGAAFLAG